MSHQQGHGISPASRRREAARALAASVVESVRSSARAIMRGDTQPQADPVTSFDLRSRVSLVPPADQGRSENCIAYALVAVVEGRVAYRDAGGLGLPPGVVDLDEVTFVREVGVSRSIDKHLQVAERQGIALHSGARIRPGFASRRGVGRMQRAVIEDGPLLAAMYVYSNFEHFTGSGIYEPAGARAADGHAICIIGFDGVEGRPDGHWIVRNSYGTGWGDHGYFRVRYGDDKLDIENFSFAVTSARR